MGKEEYKDTGETQIFNRKEFEQQLKDFESNQSNDNDANVNDVKEALAIVYGALKEKGYNPTNQIVQYIMSGEPLFITGYNKARSVITKFERDELVEEIVSSYFKYNFE